MYKDLVEQQTLTTGTGTYTVTGAVEGRISFATAYADGDTYIPYVVVDDLGAFECGLGTWNETAGTIARTVVLSSSNANAAVSWASGTKRIYVSPHSGLLDLVSVRHNYTATAAPTASNDNTQGYGRGSTWFNTLTGKRYQCNAAATGTAFWFQLAGWTTNATKRLNVTTLSSVITDETANARYGPAGLNMSGGYSAAGGNNAYGDGAFIVQSAFTTDATPTSMALDGDLATNNGIYCEGSSATSITGTVTALNNATGDMRTWDVSADLKGAADGTVTVVRGAAPADRYSSDAGLAALDIAVSGCAAGDYRCTIDVTGIAATDITWSATLLLTTSVFY